MGAWPGHADIEPVRGAGLEARTPTLLLDAAITAALTRFVTFATPVAAGLAHYFVTFTPVGGLGVTLNRNSSENSDSTISPASPVAKDVMR